MDAKRLCEAYNRSQPPPPKRIDMLAAAVLQIQQSGAGPPLPPELGMSQRGTCLIESLVPGEYVKHSSNLGYVDDSHRLTPHCFSHFTFEATGGESMVVDIQGVGDVLTDPQIHTSDGKGMRREREREREREKGRRCALSPPPPLPPSQKKIILKKNISTKKNQRVRRRQPRSEGHGSILPLARVQRPLLEAGPAEVRSVPRGRRRCCLRFRGLCRCCAPREDERQGRGRRRRTRRERSRGCGSCPVSSSSSR